MCVCVCVCLPEHHFQKGYCASVQAGVLVQDHLSHSSVCVSGAAVLSQQNSSDVRVTVSHSDGSRLPLAHGYIVLLSHLFHPVLAFDSA